MFKSFDHALYTFVHAKKGSPLQKDAMAYAIETAPPDLRRQLEKITQKAITVISKIKKTSRNKKKKGRRLRHQHEYPRVSFEEIASEITYTSIGDVEQPCIPMKIMPKYLAHLRQDNPREFARVRDTVVRDYVMQVLIQCPEATDDLLKYGLL